jgi:hypothetical protein
MSVRGRIILFGVALGIALSLRFLAQWSWFASLLVPLVGWPLGGTLVTIDDDFPGGWSNPDGTVRPPWLEAPYWGQIAVSASVCAIGGAVDAGWQTTDAKAWWVSFLCSGLFGALLIWRPWHKAQAHDT